MLLISIYSCNNIFLFKKEKEKGTLSNHGIDGGGRLLSHLNGWYAVHIFQFPVNAREAVENPSRIIN